MVFIAGLTAGVFISSAGASMLGSSVFSDIQPGSYFDSAIGRLYGQGVIKGGPDGKFHPTDYVTRADVAVMIDRAINGGTVDVPRSSSSSSRSVSSSSSSSSSVSSSSSSSSSSSLPPLTDAGAFRFTVDKVSISEGAPNVSISVMRTSGKKGAVSVSYYTTDGSATSSSPGDYISSTGTLNFADGETTKTINLKFINDAVAEPNETFTVSLKDPTGGSTLMTPNVMTVTILDNDGGGAGFSSSSSSVSGTGTSSAAGGNISFSAATYSQYENGGPVTVTVIRKGNTSAEAKVDYSTADATATAGIQYTATSGSVTFAPGETSKTFTVGINDNTSIDGNKSLTLKLANPTGGSALMSPSTATLTLVDNEASPATQTGSIMFTADAYSVREKDGSAVVTVRRLDGYGVTATVNFATSDSTAVAGSDYTAASGTLTFAPGESSKTITIPLIQDTNVENEEKINMTLSSPQRATLGTYFTTIIKITD